MIFFFLSLLRLLPSSVVAGIVLAFSLPVCPIQYILRLQAHTLYHESFCLPLRLFTGISAILVSLSPSSLRPYSCHFSHFSVIFFATESTFTDPLTCINLIWSFFVTPHILIPFNSSPLFCMSSTELTVAFNLHTCHYFVCSCHLKVVWHDNVIHQRMWSAFVIYHILIFLKNYLLPLALLWLIHNLQSLMPRITEWIRRQILTYILFILTIQLMHFCVIYSVHVL